MTNSEGAPQAQDISTDIEDADWTKPCTETQRQLPDIDIVRLRSNEWRLDGAVRLSQTTSRETSAHKDYADSIVIEPTAAVSVCRTILAAAGFGYAEFARYCKGAGMLDIEDGADPAKLGEQDQGVRSRVKEQNEKWDAAYDERFDVKKAKDPKAAERQRRRRERLKAERDKSKNVTPETVTSTQTVTPDRDEDDECHADAVTIAPSHRDREDAFAN